VKLPFTLEVKYGGMEASDVKRLKDLEAEHAELKRCMRAEHRERGDEKPDRKKAITPAEKREAVGYLVEQEQLRCSQGV